MVYDIRDFGAVGDGKTLNTGAIQAAIQAAAQTAGRVLIADGVYKTGSIRLLNNVDLHIAADGVLLGSENCADFPEWDTVHVDRDMLPRWRSACLIFAEEVENISISGTGKIDCNGYCFVQKRANEKHIWTYERIPELLTPPRVVFMVGCKNVHITDVTMINQPAGWSYWIHDCDFVHIRGINILADVNFPNNDGIHINSSRDVVIADCNITTGDDSIVVRANNVSLKENKVCERVSVTNCNLISHTNAIRIGWTKDGIIRNCTFSNLTVTDSTMGISVHIPNRIRDPKPAIPTVGTSDVGREFTLVENLAFRNIVMDRIAWEPILIRLDGETPHVKAIRNLHFSGIQARGGRFPLLDGASTCLIENVKFSDCSFCVTDSEDARPQNGCWDACAGYFPMTMHYVKNLQLSDTDFTVEK